MNTPAPELMVDHAGVCVWRTYRHGFCDAYTYHYTTKVDVGDILFWFDVRGLDVPAAKEINDRHNAYLTELGDAKPEDTFAVFQEWRMVTERALIKEAITQGIDGGLIKAPTKEKN